MKPALEAEIVPERGCLPNVNPVGLILHIAALW